MSHRTGHDVPGNRAVYAWMDHEDLRLPNLSNTISSTRRIRSACSWNRDLWEGRPMSYMPLGYEHPRRVPWPPAIRIRATSPLQIDSNATLAKASFSSLLSFSTSVIYILRGRDKERYPWDQVGCQRSIQQSDLSRRCRLSSNDRSRFVQANSLKAGNNMVLESPRTSFAHRKECPHHNT